MTACTCLSDGNAQPTPRPEPLHNGTPQRRPLEQPVNAELPPAGSASLRLEYVIAKRKKCPMRRRPQHLTRAMAMLLISTERQCLGCATDQTQCDSFDRTQFHALPAPSSWRFSGAFCEIAVDALLETTSRSSLHIAGHVLINHNSICKRHEIARASTCDVLKCTTFYCGAFGILLMNF